MTISGRGATADLVIGGHGIYAPLKQAVKRVAAVQSTAFLQRSGGSPVGSGTPQTGGGGGGSSDEGFGMGVG